MAETTMGLGVDMSDIAKSLATFPEMTGEAAEEAVKRLTASFARAERAAKALLKAQKAESEAAKKAAEEADAAAKKAAAAIHDQSRAIKAFGERAGDADTALKAVAGAVGLVSPAAEGALSSLGDLLGGAEGAAKATSLLGGSAVVAAGALTGVAVAVGAAGYAAYAATSAIVELVYGAGDLARSLAEVEAAGGAIDTIGVDAATLASFDDARAALDAIGLLGDQLALSFASEFAPAVEMSARALLKMGLIGRDLFQEMADGRGILGGLATFAARTLTGALLLPLEVINLWAAGFGKLAALVPGGEALAQSFTDLSDGLSGMRNSIADTGLQHFVDLMGPGVQGSMEVASRWTASYDDEVDALIGTAGRFAAAERDKNDEIDRGIEVSKKATSVEKAAAQSSRDAAKAAREVEEARRESLAALEADLKRVGDVQRDTNRATGDAAKATQALLAESQAFGAAAPSAVETTRQEYKALNQEILRQIEANQKAGVSTAALEEERVALAKRTKTTIADLERQARDEKLAADQAAAQEAADLYRSQQEVVLSAVSSTIGDIGAAFAAYSGLVRDNYQTTLDEITNLNEAALDAENERREEMGMEAIEMDQLVASEQVRTLEKKAAKQRKILIGLFVAEQAAALAQIAVDTALGFSAVTAAYAANPPLMLGLQALVVTSGIAQAAAVSAARPSFHSGGVVPSSQAGQGEVMSRLLPGEVVLNRSTVDRMGGPSNADRLNRGGGMGYGPLVIEQRYGHRVFDEVVYDDLRRPDSSLRKAVRGTSRVGHRSR